jgi:hypothetical protein
MARLNIVVEGQTEETFVNDLLVPHLAAFGVYTSVRCVATSRSGGRWFRGGMISYEKARKDLELWMKQEQRNTDVAFSTMFDLYRLPSDFPAFGESASLAPYERVERIESALADELGHPRFIAYIQLHEFEALVLTDPKVFALYYDKQQTSIDRLVAVRESFANPELIDDGVNTAPSKRILAEFPDYAKPTLGPLFVAAIGLPRLRDDCPHFDAWITRLERLARDMEVAQ